MLIESDFVKIQTSVPTKDAESLRKAMGDAGAGQQGNYTHCSGSFVSVGRFIPGDGAEPAIGDVGKQEEVEEEVIIMLCHKDKVASVVDIIKKNHPYEEPPIDIIPRLELS